MSHGSENNLALDEKDKEALQELEDITSRADEVQRQILSEILSTNANVEYLHQHGLNGSTDASTFKNLIPLISYEQLKPYIDRIANGDDSPILCAHPITEFFISSGTSGGEQKLIPIFDKEFGRRLSISKYVRAIKKQLSFPNLDRGKTMFFGFARDASRTKAGIIAQTVFSSFFKRSHSNQNNDTSPKDIVLCPDTYQSMYCHLLCGLYQNDMVFEVRALFASTLTYAFKFLEDHWTLLANDIRTGTITNPKITNLLVRGSVMNLLKPNPKLADFIETECRQGAWEGIITRLWPNTKHIKTVVTGSMSQYIPLINYYSNNLPLICYYYASSECFLGINLDLLCKPEEISYTLIPTMAYFEFLPVDDDDDNGDQVSQDQLVDLVDVKLGQEYELVVTTFAGLYRYCMGDILRVTGFKNKAPKFSFVCRKNVILSVDVEKTDEAELHNAVQEAAHVLSSFGGIVVDYTSYADTTTIPGHYVLYWEIRVKEEISIPPSVYEDCCLVIEESLNARYRQGRSNREKCINPLEIRIVESGTFDKMMERAVNQGASISQYKSHRCIKSREIIDLLDSSVLSHYFSQKSPKWDPTTPHHLLSTHSLSQR